MIELREITLDNYEPVLALDVAPTQRGFISSTAESLAEAYAAVASGGTPRLPRAIYDDEELVGFVMIQYVPANPASVNPQPFYLILRYMIDGRFQRKGIGTRAMSAVLDLIREKPLGEADQVYLSYARGNHVAQKMYRKLGFVETGQVTPDKGEQVARLEMHQPASSCATR
ncbi:MAG: GNAT family N-acetyltransferase [Promicromonosporaceae bacterium]|nr:GNAT family N-acetyltransferase [Promicromonosporaceae bacterium]